MSSPAYLPLFGNDYLADTTHLSTEEHGAYLLMMMAAWRQDDCALHLDDRKLARVCGLSLRKWGAIKETILEFWEVDGDRIYQPRLRRERAYVDQKSESNRENANKRWGKQRVENKQPGQSERISERNAPKPKPKVEEQEAKASRSNAREKSPPAHRLPPGWMPAPLPAEVAEIVAAWPAGAIERELSKFRDWAKSAPARTGLKSDWDAAWRNWNRKADEDGRYARNPNGNAGLRGSRPDPALDMLYQAQRELQAEEAERQNPRPDRTPRLALSAH